MLGYFMWFRALQVSSAALVPGMSYLTTFVAPLFIAVLLGEPLSWFHFGGFIWILLVVWVQGRTEQ